MVVSLRTLMRTFANEPSIWAQLSTFPLEISRVEMTPPEPTSLMVNSSKKCTSLRKFETAQAKMSSDCFKFQTAQCPSSPHDTIWFSLNLFVFKQWICFEWYPIELSTFNPKLLYFRIIPVLPPATNSLEIYTDNTFVTSPSFNQAK